jgi:hypothetical protein
LIGLLDCCEVGGGGISGAVPDGEVVLVERYLVVGVRDTACSLNIALLIAEGDVDGSFGVVVDGASDYDGIAL